MMFTLSSSDSQASCRGQEQISLRAVPGLFPSPTKAQSLHTVQVQLLLLTEHEKTVLVMKMG